MAIQIIIDSAADYSEKEIEKRGITCVPMTVSFGEHSYLDGVELSKEVFYELLKTSEDFPKTSQPSPAGFMECFSKAKENGDQVIAILISASLSGTCQSAELAKSMVEYDDIYIVDSMTVTLGIRMLVDQAVKMRNQGASAEEILEMLETLKHRVKIYAGLDTLENLYKGGRLSKGLASIGTLANLKPIVTVDAEGCVALCGKQIGIRRVLKHIYKFVEEEKIDEHYPVYFIYSGSNKNCSQLIQFLEKKGMALGEPKMRCIGPTIGTHIGEGAYGIIFVSQAEEIDEVL